MAWITTKTGKRLNTDWFDDDANQKERQINANKRQADARNKSTKERIEELIPKDSYVNDPEFKRIREKNLQLTRERLKLQDRKKELYDIIKKGTIIDKETLAEFGGDRTLAGLFAKKTPEAEKADQELKDIRKREEELDKQIEDVEKQRKSITDKNHKLQKENHRPDSISENVKKEYEGFQLDTGISHYQELLEKGKAKMVEMSPEDYLRECGVNIFHTTYERQIQIGLADPNIVESLIAKMQSGTKMYMPMLNYADEQQEGRHRAIAAMLLGIKRIPVCIVPKRR